MPDGRLFYGDNLDVLRERIPSASVDLIYLDPPFNSNRSYNVIFAQHSSLSAGDNAAQIQAFDDTWRWTPVTEEQYRSYTGGELPNRVADALSAFHTLLGENDALAYLVNMAPRLVELHRVLKATGSMYLHCDPTMSHYLKVLLDAIFGAGQFRGEIIWKRTTAHNSAKKFGPVHDVVLYYSKGGTYTWNKLHQGYDAAYVAKKYRFHDPITGQPYRLSDMTGPGVRHGESGTAWRQFNPTTIGRHWAIPEYCDTKYAQISGKSLAELSLIDRLEELDRVGLVQWPKKAEGKPEHKRYLEDMAGVALQDVWTDVDPINAKAAERLGYPTQKPLALLERILSASSNEGDVVLDPFCGCGTTIDASIRLDRQWVGIDVTYLAVDLIEKRLQHTYGESIRGTYEVHGIPRDVGSAHALFDRSPFDFERWAVSLVNGTPNEKQVGDRGIDGVVRFFADTQRNTGRVLVSVKGGRSLGPQFVRDLLGTVETNKAEMGTLITLEPSTRGMADATNHSGSYTWPINGQVFPRAQILTVPELLSGRKLNSPPSLNPYIAADRHRVSFDQLSLL